MGGYGHNFHGYSAFTTMGSRTGEIFGPVPLFPNSVVRPEDYYDYYPYDDHAPRRTSVPVTTKPYDDDFKHGFPTKAYPAGYDDEWHRQINPVLAHSRPRGGDELLPRRTVVPVATRPCVGYECPNSSPTKAYPAGDDDEDYRPHRDDEFLTKRAGVPVPVASRTSGVDEYGHGSPKKAYPARDDGKPHEMPPKRTVVPVATRTNSRECERSSPKHDIHNKWHGTQKAPASQPVIWTEWRRPQRSAAYSGNEENSTNRGSEPIISQDWSSSPRKGTQLGEATDDIDKVAEMFIQKARVARTPEGEYKAPRPSAKNPFPIPNYDSRDRRNLGVDRPTPTSPSSPCRGSPIDASGRIPTIDSREARRKYNGERV
ncbi:uncharacterized protein LOC114728093 [Neltuma alba]|uniref:uncharacterized protein LOC114728093 n=1 Tax=Neltuma alba TaxID=207710 RepID=UPI0010A534FD|nr:uncharacterized protein LOC114728093 [Prosopis alba]